MQKRHYAGVGARFAPFQRNDLGFRAERVTDKHRFWHNQFVITQIGNQCAQRCIAHRQAHHQRECESAVHEDLPELAGLRGLRVDMQRLRIVGHDREQ